MSSSKCVLFALAVTTQACGAASIGPDGGTSEALENPDGTGGSSDDMDAGAGSSAGGRSSVGGKSESGGRASSPSGGGASSGGAKQSSAGGNPGAGGMTDVPPPPKVADCNNLKEGTGWEKINPPGDLGDSQTIQIDPLNVGTLYVQMHKGGNGAHYPTDGLYKSTDCGSTWSRVPQGRNASDNGPVNINSGSFASIIIDPIDSQIMYIVPTYGVGGVWKSLNGGVDWDQMVPPDVAQYVNGLWFNALTIDPSDHRHLVAANHLGCNGPYDPNCLTETNDAGATWHLIKAPVPWAEGNGVFIKDTKTMLLSAGDLWLTTDGGGTWSKVAPGVGGAGNGNSVYQSKDGFYYLAAGGGVIQSKDFLSWKTVGGGSYRNLRGTGENLITTDFYSFTYYIASEKDPSKWSTLNEPGGPSSSTNGGVYMVYEDTHHVLYSSNFDTGLWRLVHR